MAHKLLFLSLFHMFFDFLAHSQTMLAATKELLNHFTVGLAAGILAFFCHLDARTAVARPHMFDKVGTIANRLTFEGVDKRACPQVEAIGATDLPQDKQ